MGDGDLPVPAAAARFGAWHVHDANARLAPNRGPHRADPVFHGVERFQQARDLSTAATDPWGETLMAVGRLGGWAVGLVAVLTAQPLNRLTAQDGPSRTIDTIIVVNGNIFDRDDATPEWVAHLANRPHVRTRPWVIRRRLLLNSGDPFDPARVERIAAVQEQAPADHPRPRPHVE